MDDEGQSQDPAEGQQQNGGSPQKPPSSQKGSSQGLGKRAGQQSTTQKAAGAVKKAQQTAADVQGRGKNQVKNALASYGGAYGKVAVVVWNYKKEVLYTVIAIIAIYIAIWFTIIEGLAGGGAQVAINSKNNNNNQNPLQITKSAPVTVPNGQDITYTIRFTNPTSVQDITITDTLDPNVTFVSSPDKYTIETIPVPLPNTPDIVKITWKLSDNTPGYTDSVPGPIDHTFSFTVRPNAGDIYVINPGATGTAIPVAPGGGDIPPSQNNCGGVYKFTPLLGWPGGNYGDPNCTYIVNGKFDFNTLRSMLDAQDPAHSAIWYDTIIPCESNYNPNAYNPNSSSGRGAWGLFQMNPGGSAITPASFDNGKVNWPIQITNAISYNNYLINVGKIWQYWQSRFGCAGHPPVPGV